MDFVRFFDATYRMCLQLRKPIPKFSKTSDGTHCKLQRNCTSASTAYALKHGQGAWLGQPTGFCAVQLVRVNEPSSILPMEDFSLGKRSRRPMPSAWCCTGRFKNPRIHAIRPLPVAAIRRRLKRGACAAPPMRPRHCISCGRRPRNGSTPMLVTHRTLSSIPLRGMAKARSCALWAGYGSQHAAQL